MSDRSISNSKVVVIGGAGFLGSHLVDYLIEERGCTVYVLDNLLTGMKKYIHKKAGFKWFDIRGSWGDLLKILNVFEAEYVFNYAAMPYIPDSFSDPESVFDDNAVAVMHVLNACQHSVKVKGLLQVSSAEIYGSCKDGFLTEDSPIVPHSTYGVSKAAADGLVQVRWKEAAVPAIALRQFNCLGERETHPYVIPEIISQIHNNRKDKPVGSVITIRLGNDSNRDFLYAGDAVALAVNLLEKGQFGEVYNLGSQLAISIYRLARMIAVEMGLNQFDLKIETDDSRKRPWEIWHLQSSNDKIFECVDMRPTTSLQTAIQKTVRYFYNNGNKWDWEL